MTVGPDHNSGYFKAYYIRLSQNKDKWSLDKKMSKSTQRWFEDQAKQLEAVHSEAEINEMYRKERKVNDHRNCNS